MQHSWVKCSQDWPRRAKDDFHGLFKVVETELGGENPGINQKKMCFWGLKNYETSTPG